MPLASRNTRSRLLSLQRYVSSQAACKLTLPPDIHHMGCVCPGPCCCRRRKCTELGSTSISALHRPQHRAPLPLKLATYPHERAPTTQPSTASSRARARAVGAASLTSGLGNSLPIHVRQRVRCATAVPWPAAQHHRRMDWSRVPLAAARPSGLQASRRPPPCGPKCHSGIHWPFAATKI